MIDQSLINHLRRHAGKLWLKQTAFWELHASIQDDRVDGVIGCHVPDLVVVLTTASHVAKSDMHHLMGNHTQDLIKRVHLHKFWIVSDGLTVSTHGADRVILDHFKGHGHGPEERLFKH